MKINKNKLGINLLFYLASIVFVFIIIRVFLKNKISFPKLREGLVDADDIQKMSKVRNFDMRNDNDSGLLTASNLFDPFSELVLEHLDHAEKYRNKNDSKDMLLISEIKKSAYKNIKDKLDKSFNDVKEDCKDSNPLFKKRKKEFISLLNQSPFKERKNENVKKYLEWGEDMERKIKTVRNENEKQQMETLKHYIEDTGLPVKMNKDLCRMYIEDKDSNKTNLQATQKMKDFITSVFDRGEKLFNKIKEHDYFKNVDKDYEKHLKKEKK